MGKLGIFADNLEIKTICELYNLTINVYFKKEHHFAAQPFVITGGVNVRSVTVPYSGILDWGHYDAFIPIYAWCWLNG